MDLELRTQCLAHLRAAAACLETTGHYTVTMVRLLDIVDEIEQEVVVAEAREPSRV